MNCGLPVSDADIDAPNTPACELAGKSASVNTRNVGAAALPLDGPAYIRFADWVDFVTPKVPVVVTGEPVTENSAGIVSPTLVTVPEPPPEAATVWFGQVPVIVTLLPATREGVDVPVPPCATDAIPETSVNAGWLRWGTPEVSISLIHS